MVSSRSINKLTDCLNKENMRRPSPLQKERLTVTKRARGQEHPETADALDNLGLLFQKIGDYAKVEPLYQEALQIRQKVLGPEHPATVESLNNLARLYWCLDPLLGLIAGSLV